MKTKLLFTFLLGTTLSMSAQETHMINWFRGVTANAASMTVNTGDTVMWMLTDAMPHTVTTSAGSAEAFDSGMLTAGSNYSHTFTTAGTVPYVCLFHANMSGVITVQGVAGIKDAKASGFSFFPNPVSNIITLSDNDVIDHVSVFDMAGRQLFEANSTTAVVKVYMDNYPAGTYTIKASMGEKFKMVTVVKQ
ncbi:T9SS type A sorting domain-containing protein [Flavobacterium sp. Sd200]|uniref:T9SS type A sorting domain-containing protein n=1 Tax=Flavobacterium sp. Sd200 TaxID=2692211 RepID=UPI00136B4DD2|nr:T9SS type A sorting domain-containing protein [Flavobacterium sp. Sd200]MXN93285.1 T9SS type A sorting domain-containing protein [Flavobacterium sp. Sd200]